MSSIFGALNLSDSDRVYNATQGQSVIFDAVQEYLNRVNAEMSTSMSVFVERTTADHKLRYKLPGSGYLQKTGDDGRPGAVKGYGSWDVAFPLEEYGAQLSGGQVAMAYMTVAELDRHVQTIAVQNINTVRFEMLKKIFNNAEVSFVDSIWGTLLVEPLANNDSVTFPPILGATTEATENHYLGSSYLASSISDTNNPYITIRDELEEHFGQQQGNSNVAVFINTAQVAKTEALTDYDPVNDRFIAPGANTDLPTNLPGGLPGRIVGRTNGVWVVEWKFIPANYAVGIHLDAPKPLIRRIDPADTGLGDGLQLVARDDDYPFQNTFWRHRFGFGTGNRLNGVVMDMSNTDSDYDIPSAYA
jgi:hypothetical protein